MLCNSNGICAVYSVFATGLQFYLCIWPTQAPDATLDKTTLLSLCYFSHLHHTRSLNIDPQSKWVDCVFYASSLICFLICLGFFTVLLLFLMPLLDCCTSGEVLSYLLGPYYCKRVTSLTSLNPLSSSVSSSSHRTMTGVFGRGRLVQITHVLGWAEPNTALMVCCLRWGKQQFLLAGRLIVSSLRVTAMKGKWWERRDSEGISSSALHLKKLRKDNLGLYPVPCYIWCHGCEASKVCSDFPGVFPHQAFPFCATSMAISPWRG